MAKSADAFRTISEVADWLGLPTHVLRFWESKFSQVKPVKRAGGRRYYRPADMELLGGIKKLLHDDGMTIKGAQKVLRDQGVKHVSALSQPLDGDTHAELEALPVEAVKQTPEPVAEAAPEQSTENTGSETTGPENTRSAPAAPINIFGADDDTPPEPEAEPAASTDTAATSGAAADLETVSEPAAEQSESPEPAEQPTADAEPEPDPEPELRTGISPLPSFLRPPESASDDDTATPAAPQAPKAAKADVPQDPSDTELDVAAGLLSRLAALHDTPSDNARRRLEKARAELRAFATQS